MTQYSKKNFPNWYNDYHGNPLSIGDSVRVADTFGASNINAKAVIKAFHADKDGVRSELEYAEGDKNVTRPMHKFLPLFMLVRL